MPDSLRRLALHTITTRPWSVEECIHHYAAAGLGGITFWRFSFEGRSAGAVGKMAREAGLDVAGVARGGFFTAADWWDDNRRAIEETADCGAPVLVLVCGANPQQSLEDSRAQITERLGQTLDFAARHCVKLAIEPLHPMYADTRSAINTIAQANAVCDALGSPAHLGLAIDVYHTWWDPELVTGIRNTSARQRLFSYHICDWLTTTSDLLNDRGLMGEGCIDLPRIAATVEECGFSGFHEVEIFSNRWWASDQHEYLRAIVESWRNLPELAPLMHSSADRLKEDSQSDG